MLKLHMAECPRSRIAILFATTTLSESTLSTEHFIGDSENVVKRLSQQDKNQDFWNEVIIFTSKDENLTKCHIKLS